MKFATCIKRSIGYYCTRTRGHAGPCALKPRWWMSFLDFVILGDPRCGYVNCRHRASQHRGICMVDDCQCWQFECNHKEPTPRT